MANIGVSYDILELIFDSYAVMESFSSTQDLIAIQLLCYELSLIIKPYIYQHINLKNKSVEKAFLETVTSPKFNQRLLTETRTFQITLLSSLPTHPDLGNVIKLMTRLCTLNVCYSHHDSEFMEKLEELNSCFPLTIHTLHLRPVVGETFLSVSFLNFFTLHS